MARLSIPAWDRILFAPAHAVERIFFGLAEEDSPEWRLEKALKDLAMLKTIFDNGKVLKLPCVKTLLKIQDNVSFQNVKFNFVEKAKITICNNAVIWTDKVTGCVSVPRCVCVCACVCVCVCVCVYVYWLWRPHLFVSIGDHRCYVENINLLCQVPSSLL